MLARTTRAAALSVARKAIAAATREHGVYAASSRAFSGMGKGSHTHAEGCKFVGAVRQKMFFMPARSMARYEGEMPELGPDEFFVLSPEVSGPGGMSVPAELGEIMSLSVAEGDLVKEDMIVAEIETCKASVEARCRTAGVVKKVLVADGEEVWELQPLLIVSTTT